MQIRKSLDKLIALAGGCLVFAMGGGTIAAGAAMMGSGASLFNAWRESKEKHGPESERILAQMREKVRGEFDAGETLSEEEEQLLDSADHALDAVLLESIPPPAQLAEAFGKSQGFAKAAAALVLAEVAARDDLFGEAGARAEPLARRFALTAIEAAMETALTNQAYFSRLLPFVLESIKQDTGETREDVKTIRSLVEKLAAQVAVEQGASIDALRDVGLLYGVRSPNASPHEVLEALRSAALRMRDMEGRLAQLEQESRRLANQSNRLAPPLTEARDALLQGRLDDADRYISEALSIYADVLDQQAAEIGETKRQMAEAYALQGESARLKLNYLAASQAFQSAAKLCAGKQALDFSERAATVLFDQGREFGDNAALEEAIGAFRQIADDRAGQGDFAGRNDTMNLLGLSLLALGEREGGAERLKEAEAIFREPLAGRKEESEARDWATAQCNLGGALLRLGERASGTAKLEEAVEVYGEVLREHVFEDAPLELGTIQSNLGLALMRLGERAGDIGRLREAIKMFHLALPRRPRSQVPLDWAGTQMNLGIALIRLGELLGDVASAEAAVTALEHALEEYTRTRAPLLWATTQGNLGLALVRLGEKSAHNSELEAGIRAFESALLEIKRNLYPLEWANNQMNLGLALLRLGQREPGTSRLEASVEALRRAELERTRERSPFDWAMIQNNLVVALTNLGQRQEGIETLRAAAMAAAGALTEITREQAPRLWAMVQNNLANALCQLGIRERSPARLKEAAAAYRASLEEHSRARSPVDWATATLNLGQTAALLAEFDEISAGVDDALASALEAQKLVVAIGHAPLTEWAQVIVSELSRFQSGRGQGG